MLLVANQLGKLTRLLALSPPSSLSLLGRPIRSPWFDRHKNRKYIVMTIYVTIDSSKLGKSVHASQMGWFSSATPI
jgi:hypothetical protein